MNTRRYKQIVFTLLILLVNGVAEAWADVLTSDIIVNAAANGSITVTSVTQYTSDGVNYKSGDYEVTLTATPPPFNGYSISADDIKVQPLVDPTNTRRTPGVAENLTVSGSGNEFKFVLPQRYNGAIVTATFKEVVLKPISSLDEIVNADGYYKIKDGVTTVSGTPGVTEFRGILDGNFVPFSIGGPLFNKVNGGIIRNVIISCASVSGGTNAGAIANEVIGTSNHIAAIYNCGVLSGSVSGSGYVGGIVGLLGNPNNNDAGKKQCYARVINCYSYADVSNGLYVGGIVGYNSYASIASDIRTMVMNCMFYGDIKSGTNASPVYGGKSITNVKNNDSAKRGLNTFNYYAYDKLKTKVIASDKYYCALAVEGRFLTRFEIYRQLLNSNKKLAAFYATGSTSNANQMAKWVLETADRSISGRDPYPYPILKARGKYPSIINIDAPNAPDSASATVGRNKGGKLGKTLSVTIRKKSQKTTGGQTWPTAAASDVQTTSLTLIRTDKDEDRYNFNYDKVQLPYYNDVGTGNYTEGRVVTGWKITSITKGTEGTYTAADQWNGYNFADRKCTNKDLYSKTGRVFSQGAYFDVPYGVTGIEIEPYWGNAAFLADEYYDVVDYDGQSVMQLGNQVESSTTFNGKPVKTSMNAALGTITSPGSTVYDNAIVLVGNYHQNKINGNNAAPFNGSTPFTIMSVDEDKDNEPDYSLIFHDNKRSEICPIRFDFINIPGTAQAQKPKDSGTVLNASVFNPKGWFEITNTCLIYFSQFEYENANKSGVAPVILHGGVYDQFVSTKVGSPKTTTYLHLGGNAWFKEFSNGTHSDGNGSTKHIPISVSGGEFDGFYVTGNYTANAALNTDNAECYISGGHFIEAAGAGLEQIDGDVHWQIYDADIDNFFGGGIKAPKTILGMVDIDIINSHVTTYCGGPKFGDMQTGKKVTTNAKGCVFDNFFGAGYGGTSIKKLKYFDRTSYNFETYENEFTTDRLHYFDDATDLLKSDDGALIYGYKGPGVAVDFNYEFFVWTSGSVGARLFVNFASFSLAQCNAVESNLTNCTINENFYGGGKLGKVKGDITSVLDGCTVKGNVFGAGFSATKDPIEVRDGGFVAGKQPKFTKESGMFEPGTFTGTTNFTWKNVASYPSNGGDGSDGTQLITTENLEKSNLGSVNGNVNLTIKGNSKIGTDGDTTKGNVYGGGDESYVIGSANKITVKLQGKTEVLGSVFGGGNEGPVEGSTEVNIED